MGLRDPSVFEELVTLWRMATASERVRFLSHITTGIGRPSDGYPEHHDGREITVKSMRQFEDLKDRPAPRGRARFERLDDGEGER